MMGQTISQAQYPKLYALYGSKLPDMRAHSIKGLDYGRGIDSGRSILTEQGDAIRNITGTFGNIFGGSLIITSGAFTKIDYQSSPINQNATQHGSNAFSFNASNVVPTAAENRVKNIAFLYIVKAG